MPAVQGIIMSAACDPGSNQLVWPHMDLAKDDAAPGEVSLSKIVHP